METSWPHFFFTSYYGKQNPEREAIFMNTKDIIEVVIALIILAFLLKEVFEK